MEKVLDVKVMNNVALLEMRRPKKRNAMNENLLVSLENFFYKAPKEIRCVILIGSGGHFCAGLDLDEHTLRNAEENLHHSRRWHRLMDQIQFGGKVVISALFGAVIGGGLELAAATHVRVAEKSTIFQLPEGRRGIFVGGGASLRIGRILGADRMVEMMLTGRKYDSETGLQLGLAHYQVEDGIALQHAQDLAKQVVVNAPMSNYLIINSLHHISNMASADALYAESLSAAIAQTTDDAAEGLVAFLEKRNPKFS